MSTSSQVLDVTTARLTLSRPQNDDFAELHALHSDERVWEHLPSGRHITTAQTQALIDRYDAGWQANALDVWVARDRLTQTLVGMGGPSLRGERAWNLYYRLAPEAWGRGFAQEIVHAARSATVSTGRTLPHVAFLLEHNEGSRRAAERAGLELAWRGADRGNPDPAAIRLVYADQPLDDETLALFI